RSGAGAAFTRCLAMARRSRHSDTTRRRRHERMVLSNTEAWQFNTVPLQDVGKGRPCDLVPSPFSSPWILLEPHDEFSVAMRMMRSLISYMSPGRPTRVLWCVHLSAISFRCNLIRVSGFTMVAVLSRTLRPRRLAFAASRRRWSSFSRSGFPPSCFFNTRFSSTRYSMTCCW
ncbi:MAG: hypothetical protein ACI835_005002, partial [Planctomycetota bacterium]